MQKPTVRIFLEKLPNHSGAQVGGFVLAVRPNFRSPVNLGMGVRVEQGGFADPDVSNRKSRLNYAPGTTLLLEYQRTTIPVDNWLKYVNKEYPGVAELAN